MKKIKQIFFIIVAVIIFCTIAILIPYLIQFKLNMFGATLITFGDIVGLWAICVLVGIGSAIRFLAYNIRSLQ